MTYKIIIWIWFKNMPFIDNNSKFKRRAKSRNETRTRYHPNTRFWGTPTKLLQSSEGRPLFDDNLLAESKENVRHWKSRSFFNKRKRLFSRSNGTVSHKSIIKNLQSKRLKINCIRKHSYSNLQSSSPYNFSSRPGNTKRNSKFLHWFCYKT